MKKGEFVDLAHLSAYFWDSPVGAGWEAGGITDFNFTKAKFAFYKISNKEEVILEVEETLTTGSGDIDCLAVYYGSIDANDYLTVKVLIWQSWIPGGYESTMCLDFKQLDADRFLIKTVCRDNFSGGDGVPWDTDFEMV